MIEVSCQPVKRIFYDEVSRYCVWVCKPTEIEPDLELTKYKRFTVSGEGIEFFEPGKEIKLKIEKDDNSKYEASYKMCGLGGVSSEGEEYIVNPGQEMPILMNFMAEGKAIAINEAYPDFVQKVINGHEDEIDLSLIKGVGDKLFVKYVEKLKTACTGFAMLGEISKYGMKDMGVAMKATKLYHYPENFSGKIHQEPYETYEELTSWGFNKRDGAVIDFFPDFRVSMKRCLEVCKYFLKENESQGDTRLQANILAKLVLGYAPELKEYLYKVVTENDELYYDEDTKYVSLRSTYDDERLVAEVIMEKLKPVFEYNFHPENFREVDGFKLTDEQYGILEAVQDNGIVILNGGSGCGKSSTIRALLRMLEHADKNYTLLAPTGVATKVLKKLTGRDAQTIAMNLVCGERLKDFVIVDEFSLVNIHTVAALFDKIQPTNRIVLVCDSAQLAPIGAGNPLQDMLSSKRVPTVTLTKVFRYGQGGIATYSTDAKDCKDLNIKQVFTDTTVANLIKTDDIFKATIQAYKNALKKGYKRSEILCLCPFNKSKIGTVAINNAIQAEINDKADTKISFTKEGIEVTFKIGDRVINKRNNYHAHAWDNKITTQEIFIANGDIGTIIGEDIVYDDETDAILNYHLIVRFDNGIVALDKKECKNLLLGYCISVHSSQGSQAPCVIFVSSSMHSSMLTSNLVYVALSRAQKELTIIGDCDTINEGIKIKENFLRDTWLKEMLIEGE